jgi:hydrogenase expression/formation protein HypC
MKIKKIEGNFAIVETARLSRRINIEMLTSLKVGDYCIVHAGFAIQKIDVQAAEETLKIIHEIY